MKLLYDATGRKWSKDGEFGTTSYASGIEYHDGKLEAIYAPDGRMVAEYTGGTIIRYRAEYFHQDHPVKNGEGALFFTRAARILRLQPGRHRGPGRRRPGDAAE